MHKRTVHGEQGGSNIFARHAINLCKQGQDFSTTRNHIHSKAYLRDHIRRMHVVRGVGWMCVEKKIVNNRLLLQHKNRPCKICYRTFTSKRNLNRHRKRVHKPEKQNSDEESINFAQAHPVDVEELLNLSTFDLEGALVIPLGLDPLK